ncbi:hypothetical protein ACN38_g2669 [Penicillium nordicum]|uniref:Uncharacterized protein n=1 Tax=Penicillium nordicum TaxID=229535 RepID=A0A0M9WIS9_9EURO|nr:hypothetical protein ACN38_g2669 [Penicillium nordicum]
MNVDVLLILIVPQEWLCVLPAVESPNSSERRIDNSLQRVALAGAPVCSLHMGRLSLATVVDNLSIDIDEDLLAFQPDPRLRATKYVTRHITLSLVYIASNLLLCGEEAEEELLID